MVNRAVVARGGRTARSQQGGLRLFDEVAVQHLLVARFLADEPAHLGAGGVPASSGVYGLRYHGAHPAYAGLAAHPFVYVGKGALVSERISSHVASLD